jgi:tetratricopeptide (TPR) repeat protein
MLERVRRLFTVSRQPEVIDWKKQGNALLAQGNLPEATRCYRHAAAQAPDDAAAHLNLAFALMEQEDFDGARPALQACLHLQPGNHEAHFLSARLERSNGHPEAALQACARTLSLRPDFAPASQCRNELLMQLGQACIQDGRAEQARDWFQQWVALSPQDANAHAHLGLAWEWLSQMAQAQQCYGAALLIAPDQAQALFGLGNVHMHQGRPALAVTQYSRVLENLPGHPPAMANLAKALVQCGRYEEAQEQFVQILKLQSSDCDALLGWANCELARGRAQQALRAYDQILSIAPESAEAHLNRGNALLELRQVGPALESFREASRLRPGYVEALVNIGAVMQQLNRYEDACEVYGQVLARVPDQAAAHWNLGLSRLVLGDFENGWPEAEWRWQALRREPPVSGRPAWTGDEPLQGKTIFVYSEQGIGDTLQFCRYVELLADRGAAVALRVQPALQTLLRTLPCTLLGDGNPTPPHDYQCALMSLPGAFRTTLQTVPKKVPYLSSDARLVAHFRQRVEARGSLLVGIVWSGNPAHTNDHNRSLPVADLLQAASPGVRLISLQKEVRDVDLPALAAADVAHEGEWLTDFEHTAALVECLDLVISVDTSVAHLAGALGKPVWILLPFAPDWRWLLERPDSPWYPSARLFRQQTAGDWSGVLVSVRQALSGMAATHSPGA